MIKIAKQPQDSLDLSHPTCEKTVAIAAPAMPMSATLTRYRSSTRLVTPASMEVNNGVIGSQAARKNALVTNMMNAAGAPNDLHQIPDCELAGKRFADVIPFLTQ